MKIIAQGAEAVLKQENDNLIKERIPKKYRIKEIDDKIRRLRTRSEARLLERASSIIKVPKIIKVDDKKMEIVMEFIEGEKLSENLDNIKEKNKIIEKIGESIAMLHNKNIIHGDLTTSNMILKKDGVFFIDFGLGFVSPKLEDKAVDIHLLRQALESKHYIHYQKCFEGFLKGYKKKSDDYNNIINRLEKVEKRGRYKGKNP